MLDRSRTGPRIATGSRFLVAEAPANFTSKKALRNQFGEARTRYETIPGRSEITSKAFQRRLHWNERQGNIFIRIQTVDVCKPKFQSISLCAVDAHISRLQTSSLFHEE